MRRNYFLFTCALPPVTSIPFSFLSHSVASVSTSNIDWFSCSVRLCVRPTTKLIFLRPAQRMTWSTAILWCDEVTVSPHNGEREWIPELADASLMCVCVWCCHRRRTIYCWKFVTCCGVHCVAEFSMRSNRNTSEARPISSIFYSTLDNLKPSPERAIAFHCTLCRVVCVLFIYNWKINRKTGRRRSTGGAKQKLRGELNVVGKCAAAIYFLFEWTIYFPSAMHLHTYVSVRRELHLPTVVRSAPVAVAVIFETENSDAIFYPF